jgi:hypothetical protein
MSETNYNGEPIPTRLFIEVKTAAPGKEIYESDPWFHLGSTNTMFDAQHRIDNYIKTYKWRNEEPGQKYQFRIVQEYAVREVIKTLEQQVLSQTEG